MEITGEFLSVGLSLLIAVLVGAWRLSTANAKLIQLEKEMKGYRTHLSPDRVAVRAELATEQRMTVAALVKGQEEMEDMDGKLWEKYTSHGKRIAFLEQKANGGKPAPTAGA